MSGNLKSILSEIVNQLETVAARIAATEAALLQRAALQPGDIEHKIDASPAHQELAKVRGWIALLPDAVTIEGA